MPEAVAICGEYQIDGPRDESGQVLADRVSALVPWLRCFETLLQKFPASHDDEEFVMMFRALQARYDGIPAAAHAVDWPAMNEALNRALAHILDSKLAFTETESALIGKQLPDFWVYLAERGRIAVNAAAARHDSGRAAGLSAIRREIEGPAQAGDTESQRAPDHPLSGAQSGFCHDYLDYQSVLSNAEELADYRRILVDSNEAAMRARVDARLEAMKTDARGRWQDLKVRLKGLRRSATWFRPAYCLDKPALLRKKEGSS